MSKYIADDPWLAYMELPRSKQERKRGSHKAQRALNKRIARFRHKHRHLHI